MSMVVKPLVPFDSIGALPIDLIVKVDRWGSDLKILYQMMGNIEMVALSHQEVPERRMGLWETTCFEFFFGVPGELEYWEVNLSAAGHWNVFRLDDYRSGLREDTRINTLPIAVPIAVHQQVFSLETVLDLNLLGIGDRDVELSVTAVIADRSANISYWALCHAGTEADFHLRDSFILRS